jgi:hypothetical protein
MPIEMGNIAHGLAIASAIPRNYNPDVDPVISHTNKDGALLGGVMYDGFTGSCIFMHQAGFSKSWLSRDMLWMVFDYPFNQLKCSKVCGTIPSSNPELLDFNKRIGFILEASIKGGYPTGDLLVLSMERDQCRWLDVKPRTYERRW